MRIAYVHSVSGIWESDKTVSGYPGSEPPNETPIYLLWSLVRTDNSMKTIDVYADDFKSILRNEGIIPYFTII